MKIHKCAENLSLGTSSSLWWISIIASKFELAMKGHHSDENPLIGENLSVYENSSFLWKFFTVLKIDLCDGIHHWWKFIIIVKLINITKINQIVEKSSVWGKLILVMKTLSYDENSSSG